jgi:hypothetical protein
MSMQQKNSEPSRIEPALTTSEVHRGRLPTDANLGGSGDARPTPTIRRIGRTVLRLALFGLFAILPAVAMALPNPPCEAGSGPAYPLPGAPPSTETWRGGAASDWQPPVCLGWTGGNFTLLVALAGSFHFAGGADDLLTHFGAPSTFRGIRYWSVTDRRWDTLINDAAALAGPAGPQRRPDFTGPELRAGGDLYYMQSDNRSSGDVVYRMRVLDAARHRMIIETQNQSRVRLFILTLFDPGDLESTYFLEPVAPGIWGYYSVFGIREHMIARLGSSEASYINRAVALFRHTAGIPTDQEPPPGASLSAAH